MAANPQRITSPRQATIVATVFDAVGNPVQNVPVVFSLERQPHRGDPGERGRAAVHRLQRPGARHPAHEAPAGGVQKTVTVTATTANGIEAR